MKSIKEILKEHKYRPTPYPTTIAGRKVLVRVVLGWDYTGMACVPAKPVLKAVEGLYGENLMAKIPAAERDGFAAEYWDWQVKEWRKNSA